MIQIKAPAAQLLRLRAAHSGSARVLKTRVKSKSRRPMAPLARAVEELDWPGLKRAPDCCGQSRRPIPRQTTAAGSGGVLHERRRVIHCAAGHSGSREKGLRIST